jgi:hypothetical protein
MIQTPSASDATEHLADWMELEARRSADKQTSIASLVKLFRRTGSVDAFTTASGDAGSQLTQSIAQDAFIEIENRQRACGADKYPFDVKNGLLRLCAKPEQSPYVLLLLMSFLKPTSGHEGTSVLFEEICALAALGYLGGKANQVTAVRFGSPRKVPLAKLSQAVDNLCLSLGEGGGCSLPNKAKHTGDEGLDIVAWRHFPDAKEGKLIAFGQCAAGTGDWQAKLSEMDANAFMRKWMRTTLIVAPVRLFFIPRRIPIADWQHAGIDAGILFDRCRIVACLSEADIRLQKHCRNTTKGMLSKLKRYA